MSKQRFPHLQDATNFPGNDGHPYGQYPSDFNYERWGVGTKMTVCRVPWDLDKNVVDWGSDDDNILSYFHSLDSSSFKLESELNREPDGSIRLPIPISNLKKYNYLFVEYTVPTTPEQPLDYASGDRQPFIGFFMSDFQYVAPSTTEATLVTDWWTTSITSMEIQNMLLERGHAPMAATKVEDYLQDPIHHNQYLLTSDVSYAEPCITTASQFESWMATTEPLMVLAVKATLEQAQAMLTEKKVDGQNTPPTFADTTDRWGKQYDVQGYSWAGVSPFKDATVESTPWSTATGLPAGVSMIAVKATQAQAFLTYVQTNSPELFEVVQSCFLIPGSLVASKEAGTFGGVQLFELKPLEELPPVPVKLEKEDFGYPSEYAEIAKLYTFPYAGLTFSDNDGHSVDVRIEYTSSVQIHRRVSLAYPYLRAQAFLSGVNGTGDTSYEWVDAAGLKRTGSMPQAEWTQTLMEYEIPTYALAQTAISQALLKNSTPAAIERLKALTAYQNGARALNTSTENSYDSADTAHDNGIRSNDTSKSNGDRSNDTVKNNSLASNATANANTLRSNDTSFKNTGLSNSTTAANGIRSNNAAWENAKASIATANANTLRSNKTGYDNAINGAATANANALRSNETSYDNAIASNATGNANALRSNATGYNNALASSATAKSNADRSADSSVTATANSNATNEDMVTLTNDYSTDTNNLAKDFADANFTNRMQKMRTIVGSEDGGDITKIFPNWDVKEFPTPSSMQNALFDAVASMNAEEATRISNMLVLDADAIRNLSPTTGGTSSNMLIAKGTLQGAAAAISSGWSKFKNLTELGLSAVTSVASAVGGAVGGPVGGGETASVSSGATEAVGGATSSGINAQRAVVNPAIDAVDTIAPTMISVTGDQASFKNQSAVNATLMAASIYTNQRGVAVAEKLDGAQLTLTKRNMDSGLQLSSQLNVDKNSKQRDLATRNTALSAGTAKANAAASQATANSNSLASKNTADSNANTSLATANANAANAKSTADTNANASKDTSNAIALASKNTADSNANDSQATALANAERSKTATYDAIEGTLTTANENNHSSRVTADANANDSLATANANVGRSYDTTASNLQASWTTTKTNVDQTQATTKANAGYSQDSGLLNAQTELKLTQDAYQMSIMNAKTNAPLTVGSTSGDPLPDLWGQRGVEIRVKTQPLGAIASAGSEMLRYGYQLGQAWRFQGWSVMKHFSYWKASDLWLTPRSAFAELGKAAIKGIIESGVTVWRRPEEIGTVAVTDNLED